MNQIILETNNPLDLELLLSLAKRLNVKIISPSNILSEQDKKLALMREAQNDPHFLKDIASVTNDFKYADSEIHE